MDGKIKHHVCIKFCVKLGKSTTETLEMRHKAFREHSLSRTAVSEWHSHFKADRVSVEYDERSRDQAHAKRQKVLTKFENSSTKTYAGTSMSSQSLPGDLNRKFEHAPHCSYTTTTRPLTGP
jgi:hypothetical protein